jgi:hypothetical protein
MPTSFSPRRTRVRLAGVDHQPFPDGRCSVRVKLEWQGEEYSAESEGTETSQGILRAAAKACILAAQAASEEKLQLELVGVKSVRAFDADVIITSVRGTSERSRYRLLGSCAASPHDDIARAGVLSTLNALNRILEKYV